MFDNQELTNVREVLNVKKNVASIAKHEEKQKMKFVEIVSFSINILQLQN
jgi:hypothetical protein